MAKNLIVTITGYAGEIKQGKAGEYVVVPVPVNRKNDAGQWEVAEKHYFNIALEPGHDVAKDQFYEVTGELRLSKWTNDKGEVQVSLWVSKAKFTKLAIVSKGDGGRANLEAFGAQEIAPF
jgi:hypothetical protein